MDDLEKTFISIFTWLNSTGGFSCLKSRPKLDVDRFTFISKDNIQNIELYMKSLRLIIEDEIVFSVIMEKAKKGGSQTVSSSYYELSNMVFNKANTDTYRKIKESLNALKTSIIKVQKGEQGFIFSFIDSLKFSDMDNEKGEIYIRLSSEIYEFYIKRSPYFACINLNNYRSLTGGRIQKLLFLYLKSINLTMPTPLTKIQEILQLQHLRLKDFKKSFTENFINTLLAEGIYIKISGDKLIYKKVDKQKKISVPAPESLELKTEHTELENYLKENRTVSILGKLKLRKSYILSLKQKHSEDKIVKSLRKLIYIYTSSFQEIKNPAGFLLKMLENGTFADIDEIEKKEVKSEISQLQPLILEKTNNHQQEINLEPPSQEVLSKWFDEKILELNGDEKNVKN